jgi:Kef-type K+ transport system membrane component KefB
MLIGAIQAPSGVVLEFLVLFAVILAGPIVFSRLGLPGLIGLLLGGFLIGPHGFSVIQAGNGTVPQLGQIGLLYLMFVAGLELDLHLLSAYRRAAVGLGLLAFAVPFAFGLCLGFALGWSIPATCLLGALFSSHTLLVYPTLRDAGLGGDPAVASAVGATVLTDTIALCVLAVVAGTQSGTGSVSSVLVQIGIGLVVLLVVGLLVLPRTVDVVLRRSGGDRVSRYLATFLALLAMAALAQVFGIEGIVGAFFAGIGLNRLVPNEGPSMERVEFFGTAVFVPLFVVSIGLLLDPSVMFRGQTLALAGLICAGALGGKAIACWVGGALLGFDRPQRAAMYALTVPQAAATLAATIVGFEVGLFGTTLVNAVLVLIVVSITVGAMIGQRAIAWMPAGRPAHRPLGENVLVITRSQGPSAAAVRTATLFARQDGGRGEVLIARAQDDPRLEPAVLRAIEKRIFAHGLDGRVTTTFDGLGQAVTRGVLANDPTLVIVDDRDYAGSTAETPVIVVDPASTGYGAVRVLGDGAAREIEERLERGSAAARRFRRFTGSSWRGAPPAAPAAGGTEDQPEHVTEAPEAAGGHP